MKKNTRLGGSRDLTNKFNQLVSELHENKKLNNSLGAILDNNLINNSS